MAAGLLYLDSSALVKLVIEEEESAALAKHVEGWPQRITSVVGGVEVARAALRAGGTPLPRLSVRPPFHKSSLSTF